MTTLFEDEPDDYDPDLAEISIPTSSAADRAERASAILDEIGRVEVDYRQGITDQSAMFVEDMQSRLEDARARRSVLFCSEKQLEWLESIYEKLNS